MMKWIRVAGLVAAAGLSCASLAQTAPAPTPRPGTVVDIKPNRIVLMDITRAGVRLVAVGERGFAMLSDDAGKSWRAVGTPTNRTLTAVAFEGDQLGVAVGHGGAFVRTEDGGSTWTEVTVEEAVPESLLGITSLGQGRFMAYGAFGMLFDSTDGGRTWERRMVVSEEFEAHISQVVPAGAALWLVGEAGALARSDDGGQTFVAVPSPYTGSYFGMVVAADGALVLFGMRANVFRSADAGTTWQEVDLGTTTSLNGGRVLSDGRIVLVGNGGLVAESRDNGQSFDVRWSTAGRGYSAVAEVPDGLVTAGEGGVGVLDDASLKRK
jgi:photosystem II stability/assembly factor-like uncharacterized protein